MWGSERLLVLANGAREPSLELPPPHPRLQDIAFEGLGITSTDFMQWYRSGWISAGDSGQKHKYPEFDRQIEMTRDRFGAVTLTNTRNVDLTGLHLRDTGYPYLLQRLNRLEVLIGAWVALDVQGPELSPLSPQPGGPAWYPRPRRALFFDRSVHRHPEVIIPYEVNSDHA